MKLGEMTAAFAVKVLLDRLSGGESRPQARRRRRGSARRGAVAQAGPATVPARAVKRGPLFGLMLASAGIAVPLMIIFEHPVTRVVGVLGLFTFIVAGVFVIADPGFLEQEDDAG